MIMRTPSSLYGRDAHWADTWKDPDDPRWDTTRDGGRVIHPDDEDLLRDLREIAQARQ